MKTTLQTTFINYLRRRWLEHLDRRTQREADSFDAWLDMRLP